MKFKKQFWHSALTSSALVIAGIVALACTSGPPVDAQAQALDEKNTVNLYLFWGNGCPHCAHAKAALEPYVRKHNYISYKTFEVYYSPSNQTKMQAVGAALKLDASGIPFIIVGNKPYVGFSDSTGEAIKERLEYCSVHACPDKIANIVGLATPPANDFSAHNDTPKPAGSVQDEQNQPDNFVDLPLFGSINATDFSLPLLTVIIALFDGFNPCAMWALLFIITLLIGMNNRKRMWLYGTAFIAVSASVYFLFMVAWLNLFLFVGHIVWIRSVIGMLAIATGCYYLYDWHKQRSGCAITGQEKRQQVFVRLRTIVKQERIWLGLGGVALLAAAVNIVELACSAGLPVLYTGILSGASLATWQYYAYMMLYILFFMLDDLIVFAIAMTTFKVIGIESKYARGVRLVGGIVMTVLGLLLLLAPQIIMFG